MELAQVRVRRDTNGWELRHVDDASLDTTSLQAVSIADLRTVAQHTASGAFRPLKSAPDLKRGWTARASSPEELNEALDRLYPGAVADWFAARAGTPPVTHYREFTARQTGMYRVTTMLDDAQAAAMIRAACDRRFCLKRRLWSVEGLDADAEGAKSVIPCLEPCAMLLEFARKAARLAQEETLPLRLGTAEWESVRHALQTMLDGGAEPVRIGDVGSPANPRRVALLLEKISAAIPAEEPATDAAH
jgi:hypothetical protein